MSIFIFWTVVIMSFSQNPGLSTDLDLQNFLEAETQKTRFNLLVHGLTDKCWDLCMNKVNNRLESKTESCIVNCVERFMDTTNFVLNRLERTQSAVADTSSMNFE